MSVRHGASSVKAAVSGVSFALNQRVTLGVIGESGAGKSTLALALAGLIDRSASSLSGEIFFDGVELLALDERELCRVRGSGIGVVFQDPAGSLDPSLKVASQVAGAVRHHNPESIGRGAALVEAGRILTEMGLDEALLASAPYPHQLSGGLCQRAAIAATLACRPRLLIADEPTSSLDTTVQSQIMDLLSGRQRSQGVAMIFISHDLALVSGIADRILVMKDGCVVEQGDASVVLNNPVHAYTAGLISVWEAASRGEAAAAGRDAGEASRTAQSGPLERKAKEKTAGKPSPILRIKKAGKIYARTGPVSLSRFLRPEKAAAEVLTGISLSMEAGQTLGVIGESGAGKTTLGRLAAGLEEPTSGEVELDGFTAARIKNRRLRARKAQMIWQDAPGSLDPRMKVASIIAEPLRVHGLPAGSGDARGRVYRLLDEVGLSKEIAGSYPHQLSGGEAQRVVIARALALEPELLICDEPASALDIHVKMRIAGLLERLRREWNLALMIIAHDLVLVRRLADELIVMRRGAVVERGPAERVLDHPAHPYTRQLVEAEPRLNVSAAAG
ncbi:MAG: ABC transporter ATP-binding protein [Thermoleophilia bacterium]|nr:ABC transporter ATP-binding protein [Thermoleophilia bacterium]